MPRLLNAREVAELLGVPVWSLRELVRKGKGPPHLRIGRMLRFPQNAVVQWIHEQTYAAATNPSSSAGRVASNDSIVAIQTR